MKTGVISPLTQIITIVTIVTLLIKSLLITTHEPPSRP